MREYNINKKFENEEEKKYVEKMFRKFKMLTKFYQMKRKDVYMIEIIMKLRNVSFMMVIIIQMMKII